MTTLHLAFQTLATRILNRYTSLIGVNFRTGRRTVGRGSGYEKIGAKEGEDIEMVSSGSQKEEELVEGFRNPQKLGLEGEQVQSQEEEENPESRESQMSEEMSWETWRTKM